MSAMQRRRFSAGLLAGAALPALAQGNPSEGTHYVRLSQRAPVDAPPGKVEVLAFFWYGSPQCNTFTPALEAWAGRLPGDVLFRQVPVALRDEPFTAHQRLYYTLEALGQLAALHRRVYYAIHVGRTRLDAPAEMAAFLARQGVDAEQFRAAYASKEVQAKVQRARQLSAAYKIDGVPAIGVQGRYFTTTGLAGSPQRLLAVADFLIPLARKG